METTDYNKQATEFLTSAGITFEVTLVGADCPKFCEDARKRIGMNETAKFPRTTHIHGKHYRVRFERKNPKHPAELLSAPPVVEFWNSYNDEEFNFLLGNRFTSAVKDRLFLQHGFREFREGGGGWFTTLKIGKTKRVPRPYDVLACLTKYPAGTFEEFCSEFGYDSDSRQAEAIYHAVSEEWVDVSRFFTSAEIEQLREIN